MPVQIGQPPSPAYTSPLALLTDCHRRIEHFLEVLSKVGEAVDDRLSQDQATALENALRYFREAAPKHVADEEESLFPRLRTLSADEAKQAMADLAQLESDHEDVQALHAVLETIGQRWLSGQGAIQEETVEFRRCVTELKSKYCQHIHIEDEKIFPLAERLLAVNEKATIGSEMAARRRG
jgi:hemerythrin-like domain-containing protein